MFLFKYMLNMKVVYCLLLQPYNDIILHVYKLYFYILTI